MKKATIVKPYIGMLLLLLLQTHICYQLTAQEAVAHWSYTGTTDPEINGNITAAMPITPRDTRLIQTGFLQFYSHEKTEVDLKHYVQKTVAPKTGFSLIVDEITMRIKATSYIHSNILIRYSLSSDFDEFVLLDDFLINNDTIIKSYDNLNIEVPEGEILYINLYPYNSVYNPTERIRVDYFYVMGQTDMQPVTLSYKKENWCAGDTIAKAELTGPIDGTFSSTPGLDLDPATGDINLENSLPGAYTVSYSFSEDVVATTDITIYPMPECTISGTDELLCPSSIHTFTGPEGMADYIWSVTGNAIIIGESNGREVSIETGELCDTSFNLSLTVTTLNGCSSTCDREITINDTNPVELSVPDNYSAASCLSQEDILAEFTNWLEQATFDGSCNTTLTTSPFGEQLVPPEACGGATTVTWTATNGCNEVVKSATFTVPNPKPPVSEYNFIIENPENTCIGRTTQIPANLKTITTGNNGYDGVIIKINATGPGDVLIKATDSNGDLHNFVNNGYWGPAAGYNIPAEYDTTTYWEAEFTVPGTYEITFSLVNAVDDAIVDNISETITIATSSLPSAPLFDEVLNTHTYDGTSKTAVGTVGNDEEVTWYTSETGTETTEVLTAASAGTYTAWAAAKNIITGCVSSERTEIKLIIEQADLTITANNQSKPFGTLTEFDGSEFTCEGLFTDYDVINSVSFSCDGISASAEPGIYEIIINEVSGTGLDNYNISFIPGLMSINGVVAETFYTQRAASYDAVNVGIKLENLTFDMLEDITVELQNSEGQTVAINRAVMENIDTSSPLIISPFVVNSRDFTPTNWVKLNDYELRYEDKPSSAKIKITDVAGIVYEAENHTLDESYASWDILFELSPAIISGIRSICTGEIAELIINLTGEAPWTFTWTDGSNNYTVNETYDTPHIINVSPNFTTTYSLTGLVTDGAGISEEGTGEAKVYVGPKTTVPHILACPNTTVDVPITVKSFSDVRDISLTLKYDPEVMSFAGFENGDIPFEDGEVVINDLTFDENFHFLRISSISETESLPPLPDDAVLLWLKFNYIDGNSVLEWIDYPDNSWCSYSFLSALDETGFETVEFCDTPTESYYINGSVASNPEPDVYLFFNGTIGGYDEPSAFCSTENIEATLQVSGWQAPYFVKWKVNNGEELSATLENGEELLNDQLPVGQHILQLTSLTDANGCTLSQETLQNHIYSITINPLPSVTVTSTDALCFGTASGSVSLEPDDASQIFLYTLEPGGFDSGEQTGIYKFSDLAAGTYTWTMTDVSTSCESSGIVVVGEPEIISLSGNVRYYNLGGTPLDDITITLSDPDTGSTLEVTTTNHAGDYLFDQICPGIYNIEFSTSRSIQSINSTDAGQVNAWNVAQSGSVWPTIERVRFLAGDVTGDNYVDSGDAAMIQNYFLTLGREVNLDKNWEFWKTDDPITVQPLTGNNLQVEIIPGSNDVIQDFYGLASGDFNRSFVPSVVNIKSAFTKSALTEEGLVTLLKGEEHPAKTNEMIDLPVRVLSDMQIGAISLMLQFPSEQLEVLDVYLKEDKEQSAGFNIIDDMLIIGWNSLNSVSVESGESILTIRMKVNGGEDGMPVYFTLAENPLNELADNNMLAIDNATLIMDGLLLKGSVTGTDINDRTDAFQVECFPNPFGDHLKIGYTLPENGYVNLEVTDIQGNKIIVLSNQLKTVGKHSVELEGNNLIPGVYHIAIRFTDINGHSLVKSVRVVKK